MNLKKFQAEYEENLLHCDSYVMQQHPGVLGCLKLYVTNVKKYSLERHFTRAEFSEVEDL